MSRRSALPGADELFRVTRPVGELDEGAVPDGRDVPSAGVNVAGVNVAGVNVAGGDADSGPAPGGSTASPARGAGDGSAAAASQPRRRVAVARSTRRTEAADRRSSGRERHEEKITVYVSGEELFDLEHARLVLRGEHGIVADRGRIVREAISVVLADLDAEGRRSMLVRRLGE